MPLLIIHTAQCAVRVLAIFAVMASTATGAEPLIRVDLVIDSPETTPGERTDVRVRFYAKEIFISTISYHIIRVGFYHRQTKKLVFLRESQLITPDDDLQMTKDHSARPFIHGKDIGGGECEFSDEIRAKRLGAYLIYATALGTTRDLKDITVNTLPVIVLVKPALDKAGKMKLQQIEDDDSRSFEQVKWLEHYEKVYSQNGRDNKARVDGTKGEK